jgi:hypothetical protein
MARMFPDLQLHSDLLDPAPSTAGPHLVPPLTLDPSLAPPPQLSPTLTPTVPPPPDLFGHLTDPAPAPAPSTGDKLKGLGDWLSTKPGVQADKDGVGTTVGDWRLRFMPYIPKLSEP